MKKVKKEIDKVGKTIEKNILNKVTDLIKNTLIKQPINAIPYKPLRKFFLDNINFNKDLGTVIQQLLYTIVKAIMTILVMVPIIYWVVTTSAIPMIINALNTVIIQIYNFIKYKDKFNLFFFILEEKITNYKWIRTSKEF